MSKLNEILRFAAAKGYLVLRDGTPIGVHKHPLKPYVCHDGYHHIGIKYNKHCESISVARLQAYQKYGERALTEEVEVRHLNGNPDDNSYDNIAIGSKSDNAMDKPRAIRQRTARQAAQAQRRFTDSEVQTMRELRKAGMKLLELSCRYKISKGHMSDIVNCKIYTYTVADLHKSIQAEGNGLQ